MPMPLAALCCLGKYMVGGGPAFCRGEKVTDAGRKSEIGAGRGGEKAQCHQRPEH